MQTQRTLDVRTRARLFTPAWCLARFAKLLLLYRLTYMAMFSDSLLVATTLPGAAMLGSVLASYSQRNTSSHQQASRGLGDGVGALVVLCLAALLLGWAGMRQVMQRLLASEMQGVLGRVASISRIGWPPNQERWVALAILVVGTALLEGCGKRWLGLVRPWPAVPQALQQRTMLGGAILAIALSRMFAGPELLLLALACLIPLAASDALPRWYQEAATPLSAMDLEVRHLGRLWMWIYLEMRRRRWLMVVMLRKFIVQGAMLGAVSLPLAAASASAFMLGVCATLGIGGGLTLLWVQELVPLQWPDFQVVAYSLLLFGGLTLLVAGFVQFPLPLTLLLAGFALNLLAWDASVPTLLGSPLVEMAKGRDERALWVVDLLGGLFLGVILLVWQHTQQTCSTSLSPLLTQVGQGGYGEIRCRRARHGSTPLKGRFERIFLYPAPIYLERRGTCCFWLSLPPFGGWSALSLRH